MGAKKHEYKQLFEKIDQEEDGEVYLRYKYWRLVTQYLYIWGLPKLKQTNKHLKKNCYSSSWPMIHFVLIKNKGMKIVFFLMTELSFQEK